MRKSDYAKLFTRRKNGVYQKYVNGKYIYSKDPEELYRKWQSILLNENADKIISFKKVAEEWEGEIRERVSERTWLNYKPHYENIKQHFKTSDIQTIDARMIQNYLLAAKAKNYSSTIIKTIRTILNQIFVHAVIHDYVKYNPVSDVRAPKGTSTKRYAPTDEEIYTIFKNIHQPFGFFPFLLICTGLRKAEALALTKQDIDFDAKTININKALVYVDNANPSVKDPKTENGIRTVPISDILIEPLKDHMRHTPGDLLFPCPKSNRNPGGGYMTEKAYENAWKRYCEATGLRCTAHQLRHGSATIMFESGVDVYTAQKILGHAQITTTMGIYTELREKQQEKSITNLNNGLAKYAEKGK